MCPAHGTELLAARDGVFPCPHGCSLTGEPYAGAWAVLAHQRTARSLRRLAVVARFGGDGALGEQPATSGDLATRAAAADEAVAGLCRYSELYRRLATEIRADVQPWMLAGKLFQQALTEAIWGTSIALAVQTLAGVVPVERLRPVAELLRSLRSGAHDARTVLLERDDFANNYTAWLNAAGAATSRALALLGEPDETATWIDGRHGVVEHLAAAVHPDGWEWEGSSYYHVFVLRAYLLALRGRRDLLTDELRTRLAAMVQVVATLATDRDAVVPALHDTPYGDPGWDEELYELCLLTAALPEAPDLGFLAAPLAARLPGEITRWRTTETRGWFGAAQMGLFPPPPPQRGSRLFPDAGYAVLAGRGYRAVLDLGPHGGSHGHLDKLALYLYGAGARWQPAYGVPPYGHPWRRGYYRTTAAHPTLSVDDTEQAETDGRLLYWRAEGERAEVGASADVYQGVRFERHVRAEADLLVDVVRVAADRERLFTLHLRADTEVSVRHGSGGSHTHWPGDGGLSGLHTALCVTGPGTGLPPGTGGLPEATRNPSGSHGGFGGGTGGEPVAAVLGTGADLGPADDPQRSRPHLRWQARARRAMFVSVYCLPDEVVTGLRLEESEADLAVSVDRRDGRSIRWVIPDRADPW